MDGVSAYLIEISRDGASDAHIETLFWETSQSAPIS